MSAAAEPFGASRSGSADAWAFTLLSRGDRVRGTVVATKSGTAHSLILVLAADGRADAERAAAWRDAIGGHIAVAAMDLPLCGARASDKLRLENIRPGEPLHADLVTQVASDLQRTTTWLSQQPEIDGSRLVVVALGRASELVGGFLQAEPRARIVLVPNPADDGAWADQARSALD